MIDELLNMQGTITLVTGAAGGIGSAVTKRIGDRGGRCVLHDLSGLPLSEEILGGGNVALRGNLSDKNECARLFERLDAMSIAVDHLVNCAGIYARSTVSSLNLPLIEHTFSVNTFAPVLLAKLLAERLVARSAKGRVVNVASDAWMKGPPTGAHYAGSKAALVAMTRSLARALGPRGITVNSVSPGVTRTRQPQLDDSQFAIEGAKIPLGRVAEPTDVANAILFLVSPMGSYVNGHDLVINGGCFMR
jgi:3-oxoacyl-[acyl-carrier protein] reductase